MTDTEITALAREYGEYVANNPIVAPYLNTDEKKDINIRANARRAKDVIKWMADKFCLVEKESVRKKYQEANVHVEDAIKRKNPMAEACGKGKRLVLNDLFPEIGKEVEE